METPCGSEHTPYKAAIVVSHEKLGYRSFESGPLAALYILAAEDVSIDEFVRVAFQEKIDLLSDLTRPVSNEDLWKFKLLRDASIDKVYRNVSKTDTNDFPTTTEVNEVPESKQELEAFPSDQEESVSRRRNRKEMRALKGPRNSLPVNPKDFGIDVQHKGTLISFGEVKEWILPSCADLYQLKDTIIRELVGPFALKQQDLVLASGLRAPYVCYLLRRPDHINMTARRQVETYSVFQRLLQKFFAGEIVDADLKKLKEQRLGQRAARASTASQRIAEDDSADHLVDEPNAFFVHDMSTTMRNVLETLIKSTSSNCLVSSTATAPSAQPISNVGPAPSSPSTAASLVNPTPEVIHVQSDRLGSQTLRDPRNAALFLLLSSQINLMDFVIWAMAERQKVIAFPSSVPRDEVWKYGIYGDTSMFAELPLPLITTTSTSADMSANGTSSTNLSCNNGGTSSFFNNDPFMDEHHVASPSTNKQPPPVITTLSPSHLSLKRKSDSGARCGDLMVDPRTNEGSKGDNEVGRVCLTRTKRQRSKSVNTLTRKEELAPAASLQAGSAQGRARGSTRRIPKLEGITICPDCGRRGQSIFDPNNSGPDGLVWQYFYCRNSECVRGRSSSRYIGWTTRRK